MIKIKNKHTEISADFKSMARFIGTERLMAIKEKIDYYPISRERLMREYSVTVKNLAKISRGDTDEFITKIRALDYEFFRVHTHRDEPYIYAKTKEIFVKYSGSKYSLGNYAIFIPVNDFISGTYINTHMIPLRAPRDTRRHMHHTAIVTTEFEHTNNPLDMNPYTCIGTFASPMLGALNAGDLVEVMRNVLIFLRTYNENSPLVSIVGVKHATMVGS